MPEPQTLIIILVIAVIIYGVIFIILNNKIADQDFQIALIKSNDNNRRLQNSANDHISNIIRRIGTIQPLNRDERGRFQRRSDAT